MNLRLQLRNACVLQLNLITHLLGIVLKVSLLILQLRRKAFPTPGALLRVLESVLLALICFLPPPQVVPVLVALPLQPICLRLSSFQSLLRVHALVPPVVTRLGHPGDVLL